MRRPSRTVLAACTVTAILAVLLGLPVASEFVGPGVTLGVPVDPSLRVPLGALFLSPASRELRPGDRIVAARVPDGGVWGTPSDRASLLEQLVSLQPGTVVRLAILRDRKTYELALPVTRPGLLGRFAENWPLIFVGVAFLAFAFLISLGTRHPAAAPIFAVTVSGGASILALPDLIAPDSPPLVDVRARLGVFALALVPASLMHLAARFPVVSRRFQSGLFPTFLYLFWIVLGLAGQVRLRDPGFNHAFERIVMGATLLTACSLALASLLNSRRMHVIERARARALVIGIGIAASAPLALFLGADLGPGGSPSALLLSALAFPGAVGWAIVRYRLLDPPLWVRETLLSGLVAVLALLLAAGLVSSGLGLLSAPSNALGPEAIAVALLTAASYQLFRSALSRATRPAALETMRLERLQDEATDALASAPNTAKVAQVISELLRRHLRATAIEWVPLADGHPLDPSPFSLRATRLWDRAGRPRGRAAIDRVRHRDPTPDCPEIVLPLFSATAPPFLIALGPRDDALPYSAEQLLALERVALIAKTALGSTATKELLDRLVREKTASIARHLDDRSRMLETASRISHADDASAVRTELETFLAPETAAIRWCAEEPPDAPTTFSCCVPGRSGALSHLVAAVDDPERATELRPQLQTVCTFAGLAIARLDLLSELKQEVEAQAQEIAAINTRRLHAEFVRGVAHELRKPTEEVYRLASRIGDSATPAAGSAAHRILKASAEMARSIDLLLFHSALRLDRRRIDLATLVSEAVARARSLEPNRRYLLRDLPARIAMIGDAARMASVIENLLDNAIRATEPGGRIEIRGWTEARGSRAASVFLEIEDDGRGVDPGHLHEIFEPGVTFADGGFGLGLSLCRDIVSMHRGRIEVESEPGCTVFRIALPQFGGTVSAEAGA